MTTNVQRSKMLQRLPLQPLLDVARPRTLKYLHHRVVHDGSFLAVREDAPLLGRHHDMAATLGTSPRQYARWRIAGSIPVQSADKVCVHMGLHPCEIWGDDWWQL